VQGIYTPAPRKQIGIGLHYLIPKPFGVSDFRQERKMQMDPENMVYTPKNKRTEVSKEDVLGGGGGWRSKVVPSPAGKAITHNPSAS
jgi:hypothetical protein